MRSLTLLCVVSVCLAVLCSGCIPAETLPGVDGHVSSFALDKSGNLYAGGGYTDGAFFIKWDGRSWSMPEGGVSGGSQYGPYIAAVKGDASGKVYVGGDFTEAGDVAVNNIAEWNGKSWSALGPGLNGHVLALAMDGSDNLYAGGQFTMAGELTANAVAKWDGHAWSALGNGMSDEVEALAFDGLGNLYAGGYFTTADGETVNNIAKWDGIAWSALGTGIVAGYLQPCSVYAIAIDSYNNVYAAGVFTTAGSVAARSIAKWDGAAWSALGSGVSYAPSDPSVRALAMDGSGNLYAGGIFDTAGGVAVSNIAKWDGAAWSALGAGIAGKGEEGVPWVAALQFDHSGDLYAGGSFTLAGDATVRNIAKWDGAAWSTE